MIRENKLLMHATIWMNLRDIVLSERRQIQKKNTLSDSIYEVLKKGKLILQ